VPSAQCERAPGDRILRTALLTKAVRARVGQGRRHRIQRQQLQRLFGSVGLHRNAERAALSIFLGDVDPFERFWRAVPCIQLLGLSPLLGGRLRHKAIDSRGPFAPIGADPFHRKELGSERAGEQALQRPHAVPLAGSDRPHDPGLSDRHGERSEAGRPPVGGGRMQAHPTRRQAIRVGVIARRGRAPCRCRDSGAGHTGA